MGRAAEERGGRIVSAVLKILAWNLFGAALPIGVGLFLLPRPVTTASAAVLVAAVVVANIVGWHEGRWVTRKVLAARYIIGMDPAEKETT